MNRLFATLSGLCLILASSFHAYAENDPRRGGTTEAAPAKGLGTALLYAVVNADGTVARQSGVGSVVKTGTGNYRVLFRRNVRTCAYVATIGLSGTSGTEVNSSVDVVSDAASPTGVFVDIENFSSGQVDRGFHLIVFCDD